MMSSAQVQCLLPCWKVALFEQPKKLQKNVSSYPDDITVQHEPYPEHKVLLSLLKWAIAKLSS